MQERPWKRWTDEYFKSLHEQHHLNHPVKSCTIAVGAVMLIKEDKRNWGKWKMGIVDELITDRDGVARGAKLWVGKSHLEQAIQHFYPLQLTCDRQTKGPGNKLNPDATEFTPQWETCRAAQDAREYLAAIIANEHDFWTLMFFKTENLPLCQLKINMICEPYFLQQ